MLKNTLIEYTILRKNKIIWILLIITLILLIYSVVFSYNTIDKLDNQIFKVLQNNSANEEIDISQPIEELKELSKGINPLVLINNNLLLIIMFGTIIFGIIGAILAGNEFKLKTVEIRASHFGWSQTVIGKLIFLFIATVSIVIFVTIFSYVEGLIITNFAKNELFHNEVIGLESIKINILNQMIVVICSLYFYGTLGLFFSLITRSTLIGGIVAFVVPYLEKFFASFSIEILFPTTWISALMKQNFVFIRNSFASPTIQSNTNLSTFIGLSLLIILNISLSLISIFLASKQKI